MQIIVLGMHRSGTSAFTGLIHLMGAALGPSELIAQPAFDNEKGFWERLDVSRLDDAILEALGCNWFDLANFSPARLAHPGLDTFLVQAQRIIGQLDSHRPWVLKDPRLCLTLPLWRPLLDSPVCILPHRSPTEIARSINARDQLSLPHGIALWELYTLSALRASWELPRLGCSYSRLLSEPLGEVQALYEQLCAAKVSGLRLPSEDEIRQFVVTKLYHQREDSGDQQRLLNREQLHLAASLDNGSALTWPEIPELSASATKVLGDVHQWRKDIDQSKRQSEIEQVPLELSALVEELKGVRDDNATQVKLIAKLSKEANAFQMQAMGLARRMEVEAAEKDDRIGFLTHELARMEGWLETFGNFFVNTLSSWRWRIGDGLVSWVERILFRPKPYLAAEQLLDIINEFRAWQRLGGIQQKLLGFAAAEQGGSALTDANSVTAMASPFEQLAKATRNLRLSVIIFPPSDWPVRLHRPQQIARYLGELGYYVYYVNQTLKPGIEQPGYRILGSPSANVWLCELHHSGNLASIHDITRDNMDTQTQESLLASLRALCDDLGITSPALLAYSSSWSAVTLNFPAGPAIQDLSCDLKHQVPGLSTPTRNALLLLAADHVITAWEWPSSWGPGPSSHSIICNGAEVWRFRKTSVRAGSGQNYRPRVGCVGAIGEVFDSDLLIASALAYPDWDFIVIGAIGKRAIAERGMPVNIRLLGERASCEIPDLVASLDVCIIPYKTSSLTAVLNPIALYEYLSAGKPVVTTPLPGSDAMAGLVYVANHRELFLNALRQAMAEGRDHALILARQAWAAHQDWAARATQFSEVISARLPRVSVVVLTYNNLPLTQKCLGSLEEFTDYPDWELIIVDNASQDDTPAYLTKYAARHDHVRLILNQENQGYARGNNQGLRLAEGDYIVLLNNDTFVTQGWLYGLVRHLLNNDRLGLIGPVTNRIGNQAQIKIHYNTMPDMARLASDYTRAHFRRLLPIDVVAFFCVGLSRRLLRDVGMLDEQFDIGFFEDDDYCKRTLSLGYEIAIAEDVFVHHEYSASFNLMPDVARRRLFEENQRRFEAKWGQWVPHSTHRSEPLDG
jgi:GT2 family glycosyltransferase/glycosyltransferase involved in cell wall biosynthesis